MIKPAYYNEFNKEAAAWLRELIKEGHIADGDVDERSIEDVLPSELAGYTQCHFFAGIGVWSYALRKAGWSDDRPVWTGSCPCQPFSTAGKGAAFADERHLWPAFHHLIKERRPECVLGEQVASKDADAWIDLVQADMEGLDYAFGAVAFPSAGVGAPHIRDRAYWVADSDIGKSGSKRGNAGEVRGIPQGERQPEYGSVVLGGGGADGRLAHAGCARFQEQRWKRDEPARSSAPIVAGGLDNAERIGRREGRNDDVEHDWQQFDAARNAYRSGQTNGHWRDADWLFCRDGKWRPVEPGTFPLAHGASARVGRLRGYGNAINAEAAKAFIEAFMGSKA